MPETKAKLLEVGGSGGAYASFFAAIGIWLSDSVVWLNSNYLAVMALCAVTSCAVGVYGTIARIRLAKQQKRRDSDE